MKHPLQHEDLIPGRAIGFVGLGVIVVTIAGVLVAYWIGACSTPDLRAGGASPEVRADPSAMETAVFESEAQGLTEHQRAAAYLRTYGWVDRDRGIVHVPIDVAIELYLARRGGR